MGDKRAIYGIVWGRIGMVGDIRLIWMAKIEKLICSNYDTLSVLEMILGIERCCVEKLAI